MTILLLAETAKGGLAPSTAKALTAAREIGGPVHILVAGSGLKGAADQAAKLAGVDKVLLADDAACDHQLAEPVAALYEQGRVSHVGLLARLEDQCASWDPASDARSPDRLDALVWALTEVMLTDAAPREATEEHYDF